VVLRVTITTLGMGPAEAGDDGDDGDDDKYGMRPQIHLHLHPPVSGRRSAAGRLGNCGFSRNTDCMTRCKCLRKSTRESRNIGFRAAAHET
jgi:hypothetical protein